MTSPPGAHPHHHNPIKSVPPEHALTLIPPWGHRLIEGVKVGKKLYIREMIMTLR